MFEFLKKLFSNRISDEEFDKLIEENDAHPCPHCGCYLSREIIEEEQKCPQCHQKLGVITNND